VCVSVYECVSAVGTVEVPVYVYLHSSCSHVTEVCKVCETCAEGCHAKGWGLCGCNPTILGSETCGCVFSNLTDGTVLHVVRKSVQCHSHFHWVLLGFPSYVTWPSNST
jgi:hypothetical protein